MSTILKALRRLEQDKAAESERPLQNAVVEGAAPALPAPSSRVRRLAIVLAGVALGAGGVLWLQRGGTEAPAAAPAASVAPPVAAAPPVLPALPAAAPPIPALAAAPIPTPPIGTPAAAVLEGAGEPELPGVASAPPAGPVAVAPPADPAPRLESFPAPPPEPPPVRVARAEPRPTAPVAELPVRADSEVAGAVVGGAVQRSGEERPLGEDVRAAPKARRQAARAPAALDVAVVRTVWHPKRDRRTALLLGPDEVTPREYREGDRLGALTLLRIEPSGVVFEKDGAEVMQKVGGAAGN